MKSFKDKVVWITGASSGIGKALAFQLSEKGAFLILSSRNSDELNQVRDSCHYPEKTYVLSLDLENYDDMPRVVNKALSIKGKVDVLINNAGISQRSLIHETSLVVLKKLMDVNYLGTVALTNALLPHFIEKQGGHFVTVTSLMGKFGSPFRSGYCAAKHALHGYMDVLRMEHGKDGVDVTLICPGFVRTNVARNALTASGSPQGTDDTATSKGMDVTVFAKKMLRAVARKKYEAYIGGWEVMGVYLKRLSPRLLHKTVIRSKVV